MATQEKTDKPLSRVEQLKKDVATQKGKVTNAKKAAGIEKAKDEDLNKVFAELKTLNYLQTELSEAEEWSQKRAIRTKQREAEEKKQAEKDKAAQKRFKK